ncbi:MAG: FecR domain-containing protein [Deltaproteobacteria bacterium]|nr:FecR domain-containing protein [Deltaproteobacteria bacterium]
MSHVEFDRLWALERGELEAADAEAARAHLAGCSECAARLTSIHAAQPLMMPPPVPDLGEARWRALDDQILAAAARELHRPSLWGTLRAWWETPIFKPAFAAAALAVALLVALLVGRGGPGVGPTPLALIPDPEALVNEASVLTAIDSHSGTSALVADGKLARGSSVATRPQGEAWLKLPDGSKLGVLSASRATLEEISPEAIKVSLSEGALAVSAVHEPERLLEVVAGRLTVRVVGTRFMVMRDEENSGVAVEEGVVEAIYDGKSQLVPAGSSLTLSDQGAERAALEGHEQQRIQEIVPSRPTGPARRKPVVTSHQPSDAAAWVPSAAGADAGTALPVGAEPGPEPRVDEWVALPVSDASVEPVLPEPPPVLAAGGPDAGRRNWLREQIERLRELPIPPFDVPADQVPAKLKQMSRDGHCDRVIRQVDEMLRRWPADGGASPRRERALRAALVERAKCLERRGLQDAGF